MVHKKFVYVLSYFKIKKAAHKNKPRTYSQQQNKKAMLKPYIYIYNIYTYIYM